MKLQEVLCLVLCMGYYVRSIEIQKFVQLLKEPEYMNDLPSLVSRCFAGLRETNRIACHDAEYLSKVHTMYMELSTTTVDISEIIMPPIVTLPTMGSYERVFLDYISVNKPLKSTLEQKLPVQDILKSCQSLVDTATSCDLSLSHCESYNEIQRKLLVPGIAGNNYLLRLNESLSSIAALNDINYRQQWPVITTVDVAATPVVQNCPQNMHMLVWGADKPLRARLFSSAVASVFNPILGSPSAIPASNSTAAATPLPLHVTSYTGSGYPRLTATLASLGIAVGNYRSAASAATFPSYSKVDLTMPEHYLFIPNDHLVSFYPIIPGFKDEENVGSSDADNEELRKAVLQAKEASATTAAGQSKSEHTTHLFKYCFVDASNLNKFKDALDVSTGVSEHDLTALHILQSAFFDTKMNRFASENTLAHAIKMAAATHDGPDAMSDSSTDTTSTSSSISATEPPPVTETVTPVANRRQRGSQRTAAMATGGPDGAGASNSATASQQTASTSARATGSGNSFRDWQETNQWNTLIASLTMPRPPSPDIGEIERTSVHLSWVSPYLPVASDTTRFGFNLTVCRHVMENNSSLSPSTSSPVSSHNKTPSEQQPSDNDIQCHTRSLMRYGPYLREEVDRARSLMTNSEVLRFSTILGDLAPASGYTIKLTICYDTMESMASPLSPLFVTKPVTVPSDIPREGVHVLMDANSGGSPTNINDSSDGKKKKKRKGATPTADASVKSVLVGGLRALSGALSTAVHLLFSLPVDNGGAPILGYHVYSLVHSDQMHHPNHWRWHGAYPGQPYSASEFKDMLLKDALARAVPAGSNAGKGGSSEGSGGDDGAPIVSYEWSIMVPNLLARTQYQFQIVPYNRVGNGTRSYATSPPVLTAALADPLPRSSGSQGLGHRATLYGKGHPQSTSSLHLLHSLGLALGDGTGSGSASGGEGGAYSKGVLVTIDDAIQTLTVVSPSKGEGPEGGGKIAENGSGGKGSLGVGGQGKPVVVHGWSSHHSPLLFAVVSECVWVDPPTAFVATGAGDKDVDGWLDGSVTTMIKNPEEVHDRIAVVVRGVGPIVFKILAAQEAGAIGAIIVDDGQCVAYNQHCLPGADKQRGEGFARLDAAQPWKHVRIPVLFLKQTDAELFLSLANLPTRPEMYSYVPPTFASVHDHDDDGSDGAAMDEPASEENGDATDASMTTSEPALATNPNISPTDLTPDL